MIAQEVILVSFSLMVILLFSQWAWDHTFSDEYNCRENVPIKRKYLNHEPYIDTLKFLRFHLVLLVKLSIENGRLVLKDGNGIEDSSCNKMLIFIAKIWYQIEAGDEEMSNIQLIEDIHWFWIFWVRFIKHIFNCYEAAYEVRNMEHWVTWGKLVALERLS